MKLSDHHFTMPEAPVFGTEDPFFDQEEDGRLPDADAPVTVPAGLRPQAASRLDHRRSSHDARKGTN